MKPQSLLTFIAFCFFLLSSPPPSVLGETAGLAEKCTGEFQKVTACLDYATAKVATPSQDCCSTVKELRDSKPECLCFFIQQTHNGSQEIKSLGIQESLLLQLPSACSLKNSSISDCPKLLGISPSSADAAVFTNTSSANATTTPATAVSPVASHGTSFEAQPFSQMAMAVTVAMLATFFTSLSSGSAFALG